MCGTGQVIIEKNVRLVAVKVLLPIPEHHALMFVPANSYRAGDLLLWLVRSHRIETLRNGYSGTYRKKPRTSTREL